MKKSGFFSALAGTLALALCSCATYFTQEMKDGVSFEGLKKVYVEPARGGAEVFSVYAGTSRVASEVATQTGEWLRENGYEVVSNPSEAQFIFVPLWNVSYETTDYIPGDPNTIHGGPFRDSSVRPYAVLEMQAKFPGSDEWVWRGFSPVKAYPEMFTSSSIRSQVNWCLQHFPPEKYVSSKKLIQEKKAAEKAAKQNPFSHVKPEGKWNPKTKKVEPLSESEK